MLFLLDKYFKLPIINMFKEQPSFRILQIIARNEIGQKYWRNEVLKNLGTAGYVSTFPVLTDIVIIQQWHIAGIFQTPDYRKKVRKYNLWER